MADFNYDDSYESWDDENEDSEFGSKYLEYETGYSLFIEFYGHDLDQRLSYDFTQGYDDIDHMEYLMHAYILLKLDKQDVQVIKFWVTEDGDRTVAMYEAKRMDKENWDLYETDHYE